MSSFERLSQSQFPVSNSACSVLRMQDICGGKHLWRQSPLTSTICRSNVTRMKDRVCLMAQCCITCMTELKAKAMQSTQGTMHMHKISNRKEAWFQRWLAFTTHILHMCNRHFAIKSLFAATAASSLCLIPLTPIMYGCDDMLASFSLRGSSRSRTLETVNAAVGELASCPMVPALHSNLAICSIAQKAVCCWCTSNPQS